MSRGIFSQFLKFGFDVVLLLIQLAVQLLVTAVVLGGRFAAWLVQFVIVPGVRSAAGIALMSATRASQTPRVPRPPQAPSWRERLANWCRGWWS